MADAVPPIRSARARAIARPRPVESLAVSTEKKRSNSRPTCTSSRPAAVFSKSSSPLSSSATRRSPPLYFRALLRILLRMRDSAPRSSRRMTGCSVISMTGTIPAR